jgi:hypothetical protein
MSRKPIELPPAVARAFVKEGSGLKRRRQPNGTNSNPADHCERVSVI